MPPPGCRWWLREASRTAEATLGAAGVLLGTRFYAAVESLAHPEARACLIAAGGDETLRTRVFDIVRGFDCPAPFTGRAVQNAFTRAWHGRDADLTKATEVEGPRYAAAAAAADNDDAVLWAGEGADFVTDIEPAARILARIVVEADAAIAQVAARRAGGRPKCLGDRGRPA